MPQAIELNLLKQVKILKYFIQTALPKSTVISKNKTDRSGNGTAQLKISNLKKHLNFLEMDIVDNRTVSSVHLTVLKIV